MSVSPAIVISAYSRPTSLRRLLRFIQMAKFEYDNIPLVISIDGGGAEEVVAVAESFYWAHGSKRIIRHENNLGLRNHILSCGDLTQEYGAIIMLEDDLVVSPYFYHYAVESLSFYEKDPKVAGISLYSYRTNEFANYLPFQPIDSGFDTFYMQVPSSWGQIWTANQWVLFRDYYASCVPIDENDRIPDEVKSWPESSWKKYFFKYIVEKDLYFVFPYNSYSSNWGDSGVNFESEYLFARVPMVYGKRSGFLFPHFEDSDVVYDAYMEIKPNFFKNRDLLSDFDFCVDLYGIKQQNLMTEEYILTSRNVATNIMSFGVEMFPVELNVLDKVFGDDIHLSHKLHIGGLSSQYPLTVHRVSSIHAFNYGWLTGQNSKAGTSAYRLGRSLLAPINKFKLLVRHLFPEG